MGFILNHYGQSDDLNDYQTAVSDHALFWLSLPLVLVIVLQVLYTARKQ